MTNDKSGTDNINNTTRVNIKLYASRLKNVAGAFHGTSDPYAVVTLLAGSLKEEPRVLGKTEVIQSSLSPDWITQFTIDYKFGKETRITIAIFDDGRKTGKPKSMGSAQFELGEILGSRGNVKAKILKTGGTLFCRVTKVADEDYGVLKLQLRGEDLKVSEGGGPFSRGKPDPFFVLNSQAAHTGGNRVWHQEFRSEVVRENDKPEWNQFEISLERLCGGDRDRAIQMEVFSWEKKGSHKRIGKFQTSVNGLLKAITVSERGLDLKSKGKTTGRIFVSQATVMGGSMLAPSTPYGFTASTPPMSVISLESGVDYSTFFTSSLPPTNPDKLLSSTPFPPPMVPSMSYYPISSSTSASSLPPAIPPPAFDVLEGPDVGTSTNIVEATEALDIASPPNPPSLARKHKKPEFLDYLAGGLEINLSIAIDFTGSNGDPRQPGTLHHIHPSGELNDYEKAITAVGSVIARYDSDQRFPVFGFGAKFNGKISHRFPVGNSPELVGLNGVLEGYRSVFSKGLTMSGPTVFAEVIEYAAEQAQQQFKRKQALGQQFYSVLLIVTDGAVADEQLTKVALSCANSAPLSIVIVGVGNDDFSKMKFLDTVHQSDSGMIDMVKFVEFNRFRNDRQGLTLETLSEIPSQVLQYFQDRGIQPLPPVSGDLDDMSAESYSSIDDVELDFIFGDDGSVRLANSNQAIWNAHQYGDANTFMTNRIATMDQQSTTTTITGNRVSSTPNAYSTSGHCVSPIPDGFSTPACSSSPTQNCDLMSGLSFAPTSNGYSVPINLSPGREKPKLTPYVSAQSTTGVNETRTIQVKVPADGYPGMKLRIRNPINGNEKIVSVPMGIPPGGYFPASV
jgi:hypothetical protein